MKVFQQCLRNTCDQIRFRYEQQQKLFQSACLQYEKCVEDKFKQLGFYTISTSNNTQNEDIVIGGGSANDQKLVQNSSFSLVNNYNKIVRLYDDCFKASGRGLEELDNYKDCQVSCLDQSTKTNSTGSSSTLSTNLIIVIVFSIVGFALVLFFLYKCEKKMSKKRTHRISLDIELNQKNDENELDYEPSEKENAKKRLTQQCPSPTKISQGPRIKAGLSRLNINKMIEIVNNLKQANPQVDDTDGLDEEDDEYSFQKKQQLNKQMSSEQNDRTLQNFNISHNSNYFTSKDQSKIGTYRQIDATNQMVQNLETINNQVEVGQVQSQSNTFSHKSNGVFSNEQINTLQQLNLSPKKSSENYKQSDIEIDIDIECQKNLTEEPNSQKGSNQNDKTQQFACYEYKTYTSPCASKEKQLKPNTRIQSKSGQFKPIPNLPIKINRQLSSETKQRKESYMDSSPRSPLSPEQKMSCDTQENSNESPDQLKGKQGNYQQQFELYTKSIQNKDGIEQNIQLLECNE